MTNPAFKFMHMSDEERREKGKELLILLGRKLDLIDAQGQYHTYPDFNKKQVFALIDAGADVNVEHGPTSVFEKTLAAPTPSQKAEKEKIEILKYIIQNGLDVRQRNTSEQTPLLSVSLLPVPEVVQCLLDAGADVNAHDGNQLTPLMWAVWGNKQDNMDVLLAHSHINLDMTDHAGDTALHHAVGRQNMNAVKKIVNAGANLTVYNHKGETAYDVAKMLDDKNIENYIKDTPNRLRQQFCDRVNKSLQTKKSVPVKTAKFTKKKGS